MKHVKPRDYQKIAVKACLQNLEANKDTVLQSPTGSGKTLMIALVVSHYIEKGCQVLILAHRKEIIDHIARQLRDFLGQSVGIISPD